jgi:transcriptional regulator with XRE-family HTH domain
MAANYPFMLLERRMPEHVPHKPIGPRIRLLRDKKGWSLSELAEHAGISRSYLHQIERGESVPTQDKIAQLAAALGALPSELLGQEPEEVEIPASLREFASEAHLGSAEIRMLAQVQYRGKRPSTPEEWKAIYAVIKAMLEE